MYHSTAANKNRDWYTMGKKGKRSAKTGDGKAKQGPGKARRERAAGMKEINAVLPSSRGSRARPLTSNFMAL